MRSKSLHSWRIAHILIVIAAVSFLVTLMSGVATVQAQSSGPRISPTAATVNEGDTGADLQVTIEARYPGTSNYKVCFSGTATIDEDWTGGAGTYNPDNPGQTTPVHSRFGPNHRIWGYTPESPCFEVRSQDPNTRLSVRVTVIDDDAVEGDEFIRATISPLTGPGASLTSEIRIVSDESPCTGAPFPLTEGENVPHGGGMCVMPTGTGDKDYSSVTASGKSVDGFFWGIGTDAQTGRSGTLAWGGASIDDNEVTGDRDVIFKVDGKDDIVFARVAEDDISYIHVTYTPQRAEQPARHVERVCYQYSGPGIDGIHFGCRSLIITVQRPAIISFTTNSTYVAKTTGDFDLINLQASLGFHATDDEGKPLPNRPFSHHEIVESFNEAKSAAGGDTPWPVTVEAVGATIPDEWMNHNPAGFLKLNELVGSRTVNDGIPFQHVGVTIHAGRQVTGGVRVSVRSETSALPILEFVPKVKGLPDNATSHVFTDAGQVETVDFEKVECKRKAVHLRVTINEGPLNPLYDHVVLVDGVREGQPSEAQIIRIPLCEATAR